MSDPRDKQELKVEHQYRFAEHVDTANTCGTANNVTTAFGKLEGDLNVNSAAAVTTALHADFAEHVTSALSVGFANTVDSANSVSFANTANNANNATTAFGKLEGDLNVASANQTGAAMFYDTQDPTSLHYPIRRQQSYFIAADSSGAPVLMTDVQQGSFGSIGVSSGGSITFDSSEITPFTDHLGSNVDTSWVTLSTANGQATLGTVSFVPSCGSLLEGNFDAFWEIQTGPDNLTNCLIQVGVSVAPVGQPIGVNISQLMVRYWNGNIQATANDTGWSINSEVEINAGGWNDVKQNLWAFAPSTKYLIRMQTNFTPGLTGNGSGYVDFTINGSTQRLTMGDTFHAGNFGGQNYSMPTCHAQKTNGPQMLHPFILVAQGGTGSSHPKQKLSFKRFVITTD